MRGGGKWPRIPKELCATQTLIVMEPPVELRSITVEADLDQFNSVGIPYAEVQFRYPQYGRLDTEAVKFRVSEFNAAQFIDLYVDKGKGTETQSPIEYRVVFQHEKLGSLPPSPWQKMELDNVIVNFYQLPGSYLRSIADRVEGIREYLD